MSRKKLVGIIDGNHLCYRAYYKFSNMRTLDGLKTAVIYGAPYILESVVRKLKFDHVIAVFDGGHHPFRTNLLPNYKKRDAKLGFDYEDFYHQKEVLMELLSHLGIPIVWKKGFEADDLIYQVSRIQNILGNEVCIVSGDKDFNQLVKKGLFIWNVSKNLKITHYNMATKVGYPPEKTVDFLCLTGDDSDNIPGIKGIGEKRAIEFLDKFSSIENFLSNDSYKFGKLDKTQVREVYKINKKLIDLKLFYRLHLKGIGIPYKYNPHSINLKALAKVCSKYEINTFLKSDFIETFKSIR